MQLEALRGGHLFVPTGIAAIHVKLVVFSLADLFIHCFESRLIVCFLANNDIANTINHQHLFTLHHFISLENMKVIYYHPQPAVLLCRQHTLLSTGYHYVTYWLIYQPSASYGCHPYSRLPNQPTDTNSYRATIIGSLICKNA